MNLYLRRFIIPLSCLALAQICAAVPPAPTPASETSKKSSNVLNNDSIGSPQAKILMEYFPITEGAQWTYAYLKPDTGEKIKETYTVKCIRVQKMANGTMRAVLETNENGHISRDYYSLFEDRATDNQVFTGDYVFKLPPKGGKTAWTITEKSGTVHKSIAVFGSADVYQKTYPDCVVVMEKVITNGKTALTVYYYYAKGIGLISTEVYSADMKLFTE